MQVLEVMDKCIEKDMMQDIPDSMVQTLLELLGAVRPLSALLSSSLQYQLQEKSALESMRKMMRTSSTKPLPRVANAVAASKYYNELVKEVFQVISVMEIHQDRVDQVYKVAEQPKQPFTSALMQQFTTLCANLSFLKMEVPPQYLREVYALSHDKILGSLRAVLDDLEGPKQYKLSMEELQNLLSEAMSEQT